MEGLRGFLTDRYTRPSEREKKKKKRTCGSRKATMNLRSIRMQHACCLLQSEKRSKTRGRANERVGAQRSGSIPEDRQATLRPRGTAKIRFNQIDFNQREEPRVTPRARQSGKPDDSNKRTCSGSLRVRSFPPGGPASPGS